LTRYTTLDSAQKIANAALALAMAAGSNSRTANSSPAKTKRFLVHWDGRSETSSALTIERCPDAVVESGIGALDTAWGEERLRAITRTWRGQALAEAEKLLTASLSESNVSNTVSSFVIDNRSVMRLVRLSSFRLPP
jgi:hypothetical protein